MVVAIVGLAVLARLANRWGFSAIPLYLLAGLAFGNGDLAPLRLSENIVRMGTEIGVLLLLFMLGLEYSGDELKRLRAGMELLARGEFSIVIAGLGVAIEPRLGPLSAAYGLMMAILGPLLRGSLDEYPCYQTGLL